MAYIGRDISNLSDRVVLDNITTSATATYNLLLNSVAFVPSSAESLTVSLNGVIQKPQSSYTVSGSTIVFDSALTSSDSINFILAERAITLTTVGSGSVGTSQLVDGSVSNAKLANSSITLNGSAVSLGGSATIGGGKINQVVTATNTTNTSTSSTSFVESVCQLAIQPSATDSKIFVVTHFGFKNPQHNQAYTTIYRDISGGSATNLGESTYGFVGSKYAGGEAKEVYGMSVLDSPSTTSNTEYKVYIKSVNASTIKLNPDSKWSITAMEVLA